MISGVLQRLTIIESTSTRLVLREQPLLSWLIVTSLAVLGFVLLLLHLTATAIIAFVLAGIFLLDAHSRIITFDTTANTMTIDLAYLHKRQRVNTTQLQRLREAYLHTTNDGHTQIVLVDVTGKESGLSVYSRDVHSWKAEIVTAINAVLHEAHNSNILP